MNNTEGSISPQLTQKAQGIMIGAAVGDALGWPQEQRSGIKGGKSSRTLAPSADFRSWVRVNGYRFNRYEETVRAGEYSDDTQLLLAVARSCLTQNWESHFAKVELPIWPLYQRGGGRAVLQAARFLSMGDSYPWMEEPSAKRGSSDYFSRGANGVAMRIAPHAVVTATQQNSSEMLRRVLLDGIYTHGHPRALIGGAIHALALRYALKLESTMGYNDLLISLYSDESWQVNDVLEALPREWVKSYNKNASESIESAWHRTVAETRELLEISLSSLDRGAAADDDATLQRLGCFDIKRNGAGHISAVASAYIAARAATRPMSGLLMSAFLHDADTDTLASMSASILGALHGADWLHPLAGLVQDTAYIESISRALADVAVRDTASSSVAASKATLSIRRHEVDIFKEEVFSLGIGERGEFLDGREISIEAEESLVASGGPYSVVRRRLRTYDGQTLVMDRVRRKEPSESKALPYVTDEKDQRVAPRKDQRASSEYESINYSLWENKHRQQTLFPDPLELEYSIYDPQRYSSIEELSLALLIARYEIWVREEFKRSYVAVVRDPMHAILMSRNCMEKFLLMLMDSYRGPSLDDRTSDSGVQGRELSRAGLDKYTISIARDLWRLGANMLHGRASAPNLSVARNYVETAEYVAIQAVRSIRK